MKRNNPETSNDAFKSLDPRYLREVYRQILLAIDHLGEATTEEVAAHLKIDHDKIWKRHSEMEKMDLIYRSGNKRKLKSGRMGFTWMRTNPSRTKEKKQELQSFMEDYQKEPAQSMFIQSALFP